MKRRGEAGAEDGDSVVSPAGHALRLVFVALVAVVCFAGTTGGEFVMDDTAAIVHNADVSSPTPLSAMWMHDYWGDPIGSSRSHKSYRPLTVLTFRMNYEWGGPSPFSFHAVNVALHAVASAAVAVTVFRLLSFSADTAMVAGMLFACHPVHTEAVANIVGRAELLCCIMVLAALNLYDAGLKQCGRRRVALGMGLVAAAQFCALCATLCKETGVTACGIMLVLEWTADWRLTAPLPHKRSWQLRAARGVCVVAVIAAVLVVRLVLTQSSFGPTFSRVDNPFASLHPRLARVLSFGYLHSLYAWKLVFPQVLSCDYSFDAIPAVTSPADTRNAATLALYLTVVITAVVAARYRHRVLALCLACIIIPFTPASNAFVAVATTLGERLLYIPSVGFCALACWAGSKLPPALRRLVAVVALAALAHRTMRRNADWRSPLSLFKADVLTQPRSCKLHVCLATAWLDAGNYSAAVASARAAQAIHPTYPAAAYVLGLAAERSGNLPRARKQYKRAVRADLQVYAHMSHHGLSQCTAMQIRLGQQQEFVPEVVVSALNNLGSTFIKQDASPPELKAAATLLRQGLELEPHRHSLLANLAEVLKLQKRHSEAVAMYRQALAVKEDATLHNNLGMALFESEGMAVLPTVLVHYERALQLDRHHLAALDNAAQVYTHLKLYHKAIPLLRRLVRLHPEPRRFQLRLSRVHQRRREGKGKRRPDFGNQA